MRLSQLGEAGLLDELARRELVEGIGDDTAVLEDGVVVTQDTLVDGVHFRLAWTSLHDLGYKAAAVNLSDLAAACAVPEALLVTLVLPPDSELADVVELYEGLNEAGVAVRGGDTSSGERLSVTVTAIGRSPRVPGRGGAVPGDALVVTGPLGGAAAGLRVLQLGLPDFEELTRAHRRPPFRIDLIDALRPVAHAIVDLSDGIATDAGHLAERSGCRLEIDVERLPLAARLAEVGPEPFWTMGEDYELLVSLAADDARALRLPVVGRCVEGAGVLVLENGRPLEVSGFDHFRGDNAGLRHG